MFVADDFSWTGSVHKFCLHVSSLRELTPRRGGGAFRSPRFVRSTGAGGDLVERAARLGDGYAFALAGDSDAAFARLRRAVDRLTP
jgi:hypothetical protein